LRRKVTVGECNRKFKRRVELNIEVVTEPNLMIDGGVLHPPEALPISAPSINYAWATETERNEKSHEDG
jgi:hypothetical protein